MPSYSSASGHTGMSSGGIQTTWPSHQIATGLPASLCGRSARRTARCRAFRIASLSCTRSAAGRTRSATRATRRGRPHCGSWYDAHSLTALAFDAYGTLFDVMSVTARCEALYPGQGSELARRWRLKQLQYSWLRSLMGRYADFWQITEAGLVHAAASLDLAVSPEIRRQLMAEYLALDVFPDVKPGLEALNARHVRLAVLSNGAPAMLVAVVTHAGLDGLFEAVVSVDEVGIYKPSPLVYQQLGRRLDLDLSRIGFVSSNSWDIQGAAAAGLHTIWLCRDGAEAPDDLGFLPGQVIRRLDEL